MGMKNYHHVEGSGRQDRDHIAGVMCIVPAAYAMLRNLFFIS